MTNRQNRSHSHPPPSSAFEKDIDECTTDSYFMSGPEGPEGKSPSELDAIIADYHRKVKESRMQAMHHRRMDGIALQHVFTPCMYLRMPLHRGGSHCVADAAHHAAEPDAGHGGAVSRQGISTYQVTGT